MALNKYQNFVNNLVMGKEKSEEFARASLPSNRWELFWDILKGRIGKIVLINFLILLFFLPLVAVLIFRYLLIVNYGMYYPFNQGFGIGYQAPVTIMGLAENVVFNSNLSAYLLMPIALAIASLGVSGGAYVIRNMVWTEGIFVANDFWRGIKLNFKNMLPIAMLFSLVFYATSLGTSFSQIKIATSVQNVWIWHVIKIVCIVLFVVFSMVTAQSITLCVTYEMGFFQTLKNAFLITIAMPIRSAFFFAIAIAPFSLLLMGDFMMGIGTVLLLLFSFSFFLLVWTDFSHWIYDKYINDKVKGAYKNRGIYAKNTNKKSDSEAIAQYKKQMEIAALSSLSNRPIKPITDDELKLEELPQSFTRKDIEKLNESRQKLYDDHEQYVAEHINDEKYKDVKVALDDIDVQEQEKQKRIEQAKKELQKRAKKK